MSDALTKLNPRVVTKQIGIRKPYTINVYPLSFADELSFIDNLSVILIQFFSLPQEEQSEIALISLITEFVKKNIGTIIGYVVDMEEWKELSEDQDIFKHIDNIQLLDLIQTIYQMNFADEVEKKAKEMGAMFMSVMSKAGIAQTPRQSLFQQSSDTTLSTD